MAVHTTPPDGWHRVRATHRDRKYSSATPVVYEHDDSGRRVEVVPTLVRAPGDGQEWQVRELCNDRSLVLDSAPDRAAAAAIAMEAMRGH